MDGFIFKVVYAQHNVRQKMDERVLNDNALILPRAISSETVRS